MKEIIVIVIFVALTVVVWQNIFELIDENMNQPCIEMGYDDMKFLVVEGNYYKFCITYPLDGKVGAIVLLEEE